MKKMNYFKIEKYETVRLFIHYWSGGIESIEKIRNENIVNGRFINSGLPISIEEIDLFFDWVEQGKSRKELEDFFQRKIHSLDKYLTNFKNKKNLNGTCFMFSGGELVKKTLKSHSSEEEEAISKVKGRVIPRYKRGYIVRNTKKLEWGDGIILSVNNKSRGDNARIKILFLNAGLKEFQRDLFWVEGIYTNEALSDLEIKKWILKSKGVTSFWHITHMANINNIHLNGLMPHFKVNNYEGLIYKDISSQGVQVRRERLEPIYQKNIHSYVPLYINPKNAMLYKVQKEHMDDICLLEVSLDVLGNRYIFTDGNAAITSTNFYSDVVSEFENIPWNHIFNESWTERYIDHGQIFYEPNPEVKSYMQSEFLISPKIEGKFIKKIHCQNQQTVDFVQNKLEAHRYNSNLELFHVISNPNVFF